MTVGHERACSPDRRRLPADPRWSHRWSPELPVPAPTAGRLLSAIFILTDTAAAHAHVRVVSDVVEPRRDLALSEFPGQAPSFAWPASAAHQVGHNWLDEFATVHAEPGEAFPLLIAVRLTSLFSRHEHLTF